MRRECPAPGRVASTPVAARRAGRGAGAAVHGGDVAVTGVTRGQRPRAPGRPVRRRCPARTPTAPRFAAGAVAPARWRCSPTPPGRPLVPAGVPVLVVADVRAALGPVSAAVYGQPVAGAARARRHRHQRQDDDDLPVRAGLRGGRARAGLIGTVATLIGDDEVNDRLHHARGARAAGPARGDARARRHRRRDGGVQPRAGAGPGRRHRLRRRRVHQPVPGPPRLPRRHGGLLRGQGAAVRRPAERAVVVVDDEWGRRLADGSPADGVTVSDRRRGRGTWRAVDIAERRRRQHRVPRRSGPGVDAADRLRDPGPLQRRQRAARAGDAATRSACRPRSPRRRVAAGVGARAGWSASTPGQPFLAVVDYSHKPAAVDGALRALRPLTRGPADHRARLRRRPRPGQAPAHGRDRGRAAPTCSIVTDDNPRSEDPAAIRAAMLDGRAGRAGRRARRGASRSATGPTAIAAAVAAAAARRHRARRRQGTRDRAGDRRRRAPVRRPARAARARSRRAAR